MLKRKIHPEFDVKMQKSDGQKLGAVGLITNGEHGASDSATLLSTQGILQFNNFFFSTRLHS
jgi:hypothetical protein